MLLKKSSCVFLQAFSFMRLSLMLCRCDAWTCKWLYNMCMCLCESVCLTVCMSVVCFENSINKIILLKREMLFFSEFFTNEYTLWIARTWFTAKKYSNLGKVFILSLFKRVANQTERFRFEQTSVINYLLAERCVHHTRFIEKCEMRTEKNVLVILIQKDGVEPHRLSGKEMVSVAVGSKGHADSLLEYQTIHRCWFPWKQCFLLASP